MKKLSKFCAVFLVLSVLSVLFIPAYAITWYWGGNDNTFAQNEHEDGWEDKYYALVSIQGIGTKFINGIHYYPTFSRLTYNVQGDETVVEITSEGPEDSEVRQKDDIIYDKWNYGEETTCFYRFGEARNIHINNIEEPLW